MVDISTKDAYMKMLERVMAEVRNISGKSGDRVLELRPSIMQTGKNTVITNFGHLAETLNRDPEHLARFIFKESGKAGVLEGERLTIQGKLSNEEIKRLLEIYMKEFVKCPVCGGVDTRIEAEKRFRFLQCDVCGAKSSIRKI
ncbi:MAG: translation initiation factor IF-2 subunit beta [Candidatus Terraquivivens tikiterensis]|uniref:Translation initiation factor IF-2 subunit beta n=1 Tax=Candidatus Terraquivivens tikiterensis TaxID=1980982 RepID=A0A2R7YBI2_9ARCH|nr:MAG: translation initiation factor IF-2 subunit beta [Candidatus Terraquivivens tikiterensis]